MNMYFTGQTQVEWGKLQKLYRCPASHAFWVNSSTNPTPPRQPSMGPTCPTCGMSVYFTGETFVEWGKLFKVYRCPSGHQSMGQ